MLAQQVQALGVANFRRNQPLCQRTKLLVENEDYFKTCKVDYHDGEKYPHLERDAAKPDLLAEILKPLTPAPKVSAAKK